MAAVSELIFELIGLDHASHTFEKVGGAIEANTSKLGKMQRASKMAGRALALGMAAGVAVAYESTKVAAEDEASQSRLEQQLKNTTGATQEQTDKVNEWIVAQAKAKGNGVEPLRDAMSKLVTATGDVGKAQRMLTLAQSIAAGSGKDLSTVTLALVKAHNGSMGGLTRLGLQTKLTAKDQVAYNLAQQTAVAAQDAYTAAVKKYGAGSHEAALAKAKVAAAEKKADDIQKGAVKSMTEHQALQALQTKFHGAAAKAAETTAGKEKILGVEIHELAVKIGTALIPAMTQFVGWLIKAVQWLGEHGSAVKKVLVVVGSLLALIWAMGAAMKVWAAITKVVEIGTALWSAQMWVLNAAMDANPIGLVVLAIEALVLIFVLAYTRSSTFHAIVQKTFGWLRDNVPKIIGAVVNFVKNHWVLLVSIIGGPIVAIAIQVIKHFGDIKNFIGDVVSWVVDKAKDFGKFATAVGGHIKDAWEWFKKLPDKVKGFLEDLPGDLKTIGGNIVEGLKEGIEAAAHLVWDAVQKIVDKIPKKIRQIMGIASPSKVTHDLGYFIGEGLADGMEKASGKVSDAAKKLTDKIKTQLQNLLQASASVSSGVAGAFGVSFSAQAVEAQAAVLDENGNVTTPAVAGQTVGQNFLQSLGQSSANVKALIPAFKKLKHWGWSAQMLSMLFQSGGADLIIELASDKGEADQAKGLIHGITKGANTLGGLVADNQYGDKIHQTETKLHHAKGKGKGGKGDGGDSTSERVGDTYNITLTGNLDNNDAAKKVVQAIKRYKREVEGNRDLGIA